MRQGVVTGVLIVLVVTGATVIASAAWITLDSLLANFR